MDRVARRGTRAGSARRPARCGRRSPRRPAGSPGAATGRRPPRSRRRSRRSRRRSPVPGPSGDGAAAAPEGIRRGTVPAVTGAVELRSRATAAMIGSTRSGTGSAARIRTALRIRADRPGEGLASGRSARRVPRRPPPAAPPRAHRPSGRKGRAACARSSRRLLLVRDRRSRAPAGLGTSGSSRCPPRPRAHRPSLDTKGRTPPRGGRPHGARSTPTGARPPARRGRSASATLRGRNRSSHGSSARRCRRKRVHRAVPHDAEEPRAELAIATEPLEEAERAQERFLRDVLGELAVAREMPREAERVGLELPNQVLEREEVAPARALHRSRIRIPHPLPLSSARHGGVGAEGFPRARPGIRRSPCASVRPSARRPPPRVTGSMRPWAVSTGSPRAGSTRCVRTRTSTGRRPCRRPGPPRPRRVRRRGVRRRPIARAR